MVCLSEKVFFHVFAEIGQYKRLFPVCYTIALPNLPETDTFGISPETTVELGRLTSSYKVANHFFQGFCIMWISAGLNAFLDTFCSFRLDNLVTAKRFIWLVPGCDQGSVYPLTKL